MQPTRTGSAVAGPDQQAAEYTGPSVANLYDRVAQFDGPRQSRRYSDDLRHHRADQHNLGRWVDPTKLVAVTDVIARRLPVDHDQDYGQWAITEERSSTL
jgi:hypothetical protein